MILNDSLFLDLWFTDKRTPAHESGHYCLHNAALAYFYGLTAWKVFVDGFL